MTLLKQKNKLVQQAANLKVKAANLNTQKVQLEALQEQAETQQQQAEKLKQTLTDELTLAGGDERGTDTRLVDLQEAMTDAIGVQVVSPPGDQQGGERGGLHGGPQVRPGRRAHDRAGADDPRLHRPPGDRGL